MSYQPDIHTCDCHQLLGVQYNVTIINVPLTQQHSQYTQYMLDYFAIVFNSTPQCNHAINNADCSMYTHIPYILYLIETHTNYIRGHSMKLFFKKTIKISLFVQQVDNIWNFLPEMVSATSVSNFKHKLDLHWVNRIWI